MTSETPDQQQAATTARDRRGPDGRFAPGNPGRPKGARHIVHRMLDEIGDQNAKDVWEKCIELAKGGDVEAIRVVMARVMPARKLNPVKIELLDRIETSGDVVDAMMRVTTAVARGEISPDEGQAVTAILEGARRAIETHVIGRRLQVLEQTLAAERAIEAPAWTDGAGE